MLPPLLSGLIAGLVAYGLSKTVRSKPEQRAGRQWVEYGGAYKALGVAFFPLSAFVSYAASQASPDQAALAGLIACVFWLGTAYLAFEFFFVKLSFDDGYIYHWTALWRRPRKVPWSAVVDVRYSPVTQTFTVVTDGYGTLPVSPLANGHQALIDRAVAEIEARPSSDASA